MALNSSHRRCRAPTAGRCPPGRWWSRPADPPALQPRAQAAPAPPAPRQMGPDPQQRPGLHPPPLGFAPTRVSLTSSLGPAAARGPSFVAPARGRRVSPSGRRGLVCWRPPAPAYNGINLPRCTLPRSPPHQPSPSPPGPRGAVGLGTGCIPGSSHRSPTAQPAPRRDRHPSQHL